MPGRGWLINDEARLETLRHHGMFGSAAELRFDRLTAAAADFANTPMAVINIISADAQWFKSRHGTDMAEPPIEHSLCVHTLTEGGELVIADLTKDDRTNKLPCVNENPNLRFYAGVPIVVDGQAVGTLAVMDLEPRPEGISLLESSALSGLAACASKMMEDPELVLFPDLAQA